jgi:hypothetical protein
MGKWVFYHNPIETDFKRVSRLTQAFCQSRHVARPWCHRGIRLGELGGLGRVAAGEHTVCHRIRSSLTRPAWPLSVLSPDAGPRKDELAHQQAVDHEPSGGCAPQRLQHNFTGALQIRRQNPLRCHDSDENCASERSFRASFTAPTPHKQFSDRHSTTSKKANSGMILSSSRRRS